MKLKNIFKYGFLFLAMGAMLTGCSEGGNSSNSGNTNTSSEGSSSSEPFKAVSQKPGEVDGFVGNTVEVTPKSGDLIATFEIEDFGTIKAVLFPEAAPMGVENFQKLADQGFYKGLTIHRVVDQFMFQGGSTNGDGTGGDAAVNGGSFGIETTQNARHFYGALCYANAMGSNSTQFYIVNNTQAQDLNLINKTVLTGNIQTYEEYAGLAKEAGNTMYEDYYKFQAQYYQNTLDWFEYATDGIKSLYKEKGGTPSLDGNYTVFGQVYEGFDVISAISAVEVKDNGSGEISKPVQTITIKDVTVSLYK